MARGRVNASTEGIFGDLDAKWEETKGKKSSDKFDFPAGNYICELKSIKLEKDDDGHPKITFTSVIDRGDHEGKVITHNLVIKDHTANFTAEIAMDVFRGNLQSCGLDTSEVSVKDLPKEISALVKKHPLIKINAVTNKKNPRFKSFYYQGLVEEESNEDGEVPFDPDEENESDGESEDSDEEDIPQVDDKCKHKPDGKRRAIDCYVTSVDEDERTSSLKDGKGNEYGDVPWDEMELIFD